MGCSYTDTDNEELSVLDDIILILINYQYGMILYWSIL